MSLVIPQVASIIADVVDEGQHDISDSAGPLWSESWYFDCVSSNGEFGFYGRLARLPNQDKGNFFGGILRPNKKSIEFVDMQTTLPESDSTTQKVSTGRFTVESQCLEPLKKFALKVQGTGASFSNPSASLTGGIGTDVEDVDINLVWDTSGMAYQKEGLTRYEMPCQVSGTINFGEETISLQNAPGERNHSWGIRNWWVADWVWSAIHFSDGMDIFTIALGRGAKSNSPCGTIQQNGKITEITSVINDFDLIRNGFPGNLTLRIEPGDLVIECEKINEVSLRLVDLEGRESHLPRVMCKARSNRGQTGVGWLDFNIVTRKEARTTSKCKHEEIDHCKSIEDGRK